MCGHLQQRMATSTTSENREFSAFTGSATEEYLRAIDEHVIRPLSDTAIADHCFAAAMLMFAAIDGLGKLIHPKEDAGAGERFRDFLPRLGVRYQQMEHQLWNLRNSLDHNAINLACYMSRTDDAAGEHLEFHGQNFFVHTGRLLVDLRVAVEKLATDFQSKSDLFQRAESRLEVINAEQPGWPNKSVQTTPAPRIGFRLASRR